MKKLALEDRILMPVELICKADGLPMPTPEYRFDHARRWRFDWAWPDYKVALEIEGGVWRQGRHTRAKGYIGDMQKYSEAAIQGWCVIRVLPQQIAESGALVARALITHNWHAPDVDSQGTPPTRGVGDARPPRERRIGTQPQRSTERRSVPITTRTTHGR